MGTIEEMIAEERQAIESELAAALDDRDDANERVKAARAKLDAAPRLHVRRTRKARVGFTLAPTNWKELLEFAELAAKSDLVPKDYRGKPANIVLAVQWGGELGVAPLQAMQGIA